LYAFSGAGLPALREAEAKARAETPGNAERQRRLLDLISRIEKKGNPTIQAAGARPLAARQPPGAAQGRLALVPSAANEYVTAEVGDALTLLAARDGKPDPALLKGVADPLPARRAASAAALLRAGLKDQMPLVKPLLEDADARVR